MNIAGVVKDWLLIGLSGAASIRWEFKHKAVHKGIASNNATPLQPHDTVQS